jgi:transcriptional antiterminator NusG
MESQDIITTEEAPVKEKVTETVQMIEEKELQVLEKAVEEAEYDWVLIRTYTKREKSVKSNIENRLEILNLHEYVPEIIVPEETVIQIDNGVKKKVTRVRMPGYILANMDTYNDEIVAEIRKVNGVVNYAGGSFEPIPLSQKEVMNILAPIITKAPHENIAKGAPEAGHSHGRKASGTRVEIDYVVGETVIVTSGPFEGLEASISSIDVEHERIHVLITMFGRETPVDLHVTEVKKQA